MWAVEDVEGPMFVRSYFRDADKLLLSELVSSDQDN